MIKNCKVKYLGSAGDPCRLTTNGIYEVVNGFLTDDDGMKRPCTGDPFDDEEELKRWANGKCEIMEESKMFTKDDLRTGMEVLLRYGATAFVVKEAGLSENDYLIWNNGSECLDLSDYDNSLKFVPNCLDPERFDIMKVFVGESPLQLFQKGECKRVVFDRNAGIGCEPPVKEISVEEAEKALTEKYGENVKIRVGA